MKLQREALAWKHEEPLWHKFKDWSVKGRQEYTALAWWEPETAERLCEAYGLQSIWEYFVATQTKLIFRGNISGSSRIQYA